MISRSGRGARRGTAKRKGDRTRRDDEDKLGQRADWETLGKLENQGRDQRGQDASDNPELLFRAGFLHIPPFRAVESGCR